MAHHVLAAQTLMSQVDARRTAKITDGPPDGLGRVRALTFDAKTSKWLEPILEACADPRIESLDKNGKNQLTVTFVSTTKADDRTPFMLDEADSVLNSSSE